MRTAICLGLGMLVCATRAAAIDVGARVNPPLATAYIMPDESSALGIRAAKEMACEMAARAGLALPIPFSVRQWTKQENGSYVPGDDLITGQVSECQPRVPAKLMF